MNYLSLLFFINKMKGKKMEQIEQLKKAKAVTKDDINKVIEGGVKGSQFEEFMTDIIIRDIFHANKNNSDTKLTKRLNDIYAKGEPEEIELTKKWVKTRLQVLVKAKRVQRMLLGDKSKTQSITIKKINNGVLEGDKCVNKKMFKDGDLGLFKVVVESKKTTEKKTFTEELFKLMEKFEKFPHDLISVALTQMTPEQIMEELKVKKVA